MRSKSRESSTFSNRRCSLRCDCSSLDNAQQVYSSILIWWFHDPPGIMNTGPPKHIQQFGIRSAACRVSTILKLFRMQHCRTSGSMHWRLIRFTNLFHHLLPVFQTALTHFQTFSLGFQSFIVFLCILKLVLVNFHLNSYIKPAADKHSSVRSNTAVVLYRTDRRRPASIKPRTRTACQKYDTSGIYVLLGCHPSGEASKRRWRSARWGNRIN